MTRTPTRRFPNTTNLWLHVISNPNGTWGFVGSVPFSLAYTMLDGSPLDAQTIADIKQVGPGLLRGRRIAARTFPTREAAIAAAAAEGLTVANEG